MSDKGMALVLGGMCTGKLCNRVLPHDFTATECMQVSCLKMGFQ